MKKTPKNEVAVIEPKKLDMSMIKMDSEVKMSDIVDLFAVRYEQNLKSLRKKAEEARLTLQDALKKVMEDARKSFDESEYKTAHPLFSFNKTQEVRVSSDSKEVNATIVYDCKGRKDQYGNRGCGGVAVEVSQKLGANLTKAIEKAQEALTKNGVELTKILTDLRDVDSRARLVRARIIEQKLGSVGLESLLQDPELLKLIDVQQN